MRSTQISEARRYRNPHGWEYLVTRVFPKQQPEGPPVATVEYTVLSGPCAGKNCECDRAEFAGRMEDFADIAKTPGESK